MLSTRSLIVLTFIFGKCYSQDVSGLYSFKTDSIKLKPFTANKVIVYNYRNVSFLFDFNEFKGELTKLSKGNYHVSSAKAALSKINKEIGKADTAHFDQATFTKINWAPFENFLCDHITKGKCLLVDSNGITQSLIIRVYGIMRNDRYIMWTGWRYYLPQISKWFLECTESES